MMAKTTKSLNNYVDIPETIHSARQGDKIAMQDNLTYSIPSNEIQDNFVISTSPVMVTFTIFKE